MYMEAGLVNKAHSLFNLGEFERAKSLYQQLSDKLGKGLFDVNIMLCDSRLVDPDAELFAVSPDIANTIEEGRLDAAAGQLEQQLNKTQQQLEYYFALSQNLNLRLKRQ